MSVEFLKDEANMIDDMTTLEKCNRWLDWYTSRWSRRVSLQALASQKLNSKVPKFPSKKIL